jgi:hypothetical protein
MRGWREYHYTHTILFASSLCLAAQYLSHLHLGGSILASISHYILTLFGYLQETIVVCLITPIDDYFDLPILFVGIV